MSICLLFCRLPITSLYGARYCSTTSTTTILKWHSMQLQHWAFETAGMQHDYVVGDSAACKLKPHGVQFFLLTSQAWELQRL